MLTSPHREGPHSLSPIITRTRTTFQGTHRFPHTAEGKPQPVGWTLISSLRKIIETDLKDSVRVHTKSAFQELIMEGRRAVGLKYSDEAGTTHSRLFGTVVLAAGGYANDHQDRSLLDRFTPELAKLPTTNGPFATGDVIKALLQQDLGAQTTLMDKVQIHPTGFLEVKQPNFHTKFLAPEALRGCGAILLCGGKRFANELGRRDYLTKEVFEHCTPLQGNPGFPIAAAMLLTQEAVDKYGASSMGFYKFKGLVEDVETLENAATKMGVDAAVLRQTLAEYNRSAEKGVDEFGKTVFPVRFPEDAHFYVAFTTPTLHYCMGGLAINEHAEVLREDDVPIPGLFGNNRLGGNSLLELLGFCWHGAWSLGGWPGATRRAAEIPEEGVLSALASGASVAATTMRGQTALMFAASARGAGGQECLQLLLDGRAEIEAKDRYGWTALLYGCRNDCQSQVKSLLDQRAQLKVSTHDGRTAIMLAALEGGSLA
ncbi:osm1 [Symbiodinium sp. CCMP2592]|nr:osm1 [Symbiodinium sp. CCMP2592]